MRSMPISRILYRPSQARGGDDHLSATRVTARLLRSGSNGRAVRFRRAERLSSASCFRWGLPERTSPYGSVSSYLTISPFPPEGGGLFLWHFPSSCPDRTLSCTLPCEARTFLTTCVQARKRRGHPAYSASASILYKERHPLIGWRSWTAEAWRGYLTIMSLRGSVPVISMTVACFVIA